MVKDNLLLSAPPPLFPDIYGDSIISDFPCVNQSIDAYASIIHRTHMMSVHNLIVERTNISLRIHLNFHLLFPETQRLNILSSHLPLCMIHQIMRMLMNIPNFLITVVVISVIFHLTMMLIHSLLIFLIHWSPMFYLLMKWKPCRLSRHFSLR